MIFKPEIEENLLKLNSKIQDIEDLCSSFNQKKLYSDILEFTKLFSQVVNFLSPKIVKSRVSARYLAINRKLLGTGYYNYSRVVPLKGGWWQRRIRSFEGMTEGWEELKNSVESNYQRDSTYIRDLTKWDRLVKCFEYVSRINDLINPKPLIYNLPLEVSSYDFEIKDKTITKIKNKTYTQLKTILKIEQSTSEKSPDCSIYLTVESDSIWSFETLSLTQSQLNLTFCSIADSSQILLPLLDQVKNDISTLLIKAETEIPIIISEFKTNFSSELVFTNL